MTISLGTPNQVNISSYMNSTTDFFVSLNKATLKYYFPFPFIDQVLDTLSGKRYFTATLDQMPLQP